MGDINNIALISAAGSGKTHALTKRFLYLLLHKNNYPLNSIYAITFTKAAAYEMKSRIIDYLNVLSTGVITSEREKDVFEYFSGVFPGVEINKIAEEKKNYLLHNLSDLNVSTFHSLFAGFLSVIPFEAGILPGYRIIEEQEEDIIIEKSVEIFLENAYSDEKLSRFIRNLIEEIQEKNTKTVLMELYHQYKPWLTLLQDLFKEEKFWKQRLEESKIKVIEALKEFKNFVNDNIEGTYTAKNKVDSNWNKFLKNIDEFLEKVNFESLSLLIRYFLSRNGMEKSYFNKFKERIIDKEKYNTLVKNITTSIIEFLEAQSNIEIIIHFRPIIEIHKIFQNEKRKENVITFADIEDYVLNALKNTEEIDYLYFKLGADINHLMIDEFQDTSYKQIDILTPILDEITAYNPEKKSFFYVGDPHQAIFRWRGGAPELFDELKIRYKGKIVEEKLEKNFRSKKEIIEFVNRILQKDDKADPEKTGGWVIIEEMGNFMNKDERNENVRQKVVEIINILKQKGYKEEDIAILTRTNEFASQLAETLSNNNIPCLSRARASLVEELDIQFIFLLLKFLNNPEDDFSLFHILVSPVFKFSEESIRAIKKDKKKLFLALKDALPDHEVTKKITELLNLVYFMNPYQLIFNICKILNIKISYPIATLLDATIDYLENGCGSLADFIRWFEDYGPAIEVKEAQVEGVRVMTVHKAKGLEFEVVILPETNWSSKEGGLIFSYCENSRPDKIYLYKYGKYIPGLEDKEKELEYKDDLNLLYVALTRAKSGIYILSYTYSNKSSPWLETIKDRLGEEVFPVREIPAKESTHVVTGERKILYPIFDKETLKVKEERDTYSPTERGLEIIEPARKRGMEFGDIVHKALSKVLWLDGIEIEKAIGRIVTEIERNCIKRPDESGEIKTRLTRILTDTFTDPDLRFIFYRDGYNKECKNELNIYYEKERADVSAHIDRVIIEPKRITIIDYKLGKEKKEYIDQMRDYKEGISIIYPHSEVITYLLFLEENRGNKLKRVL
jgi:ATP-dependent helicase/nuclease subunit A